MGTSVRFTKYFHFSFLSKRSGRRRGAKRLVWYSDMVNQGEHGLLSGLPVECSRLRVISCHCFLRHDTRYRFEHMMRGRVVALAVTRAVTSFREQLRVATHGETKRYHVYHAQMKTWSNMYKKKVLCGIPGCRVYPQAWRILRGVCGGCGSSSTQSRNGQLGP